MKKGLIWLLLVLPVTLWAQERVKVKMKSGSVVTGKLIEYKIDEYLIIEIYDDTNLRIPFSEFASFKKLKHAQTVLEEGRKYYNYSAVGLIFVSTEGLEGLDWNLHTIHGIQWNSKLKSGLGVGVDRYGDFSALPVYLGGRAELGKSKTVPSFFANAGYGHLWLKENRGGWLDVDQTNGGLFWELGVGMTIRRPSTHYSLSLSYKNQHASIDYTAVDWWTGFTESYHEERIFRNMAFTFGVSF